MTILGVIVRTHPRDAVEVDARLRQLPGVDVATTAQAQDGRIVVVIEDSADSSAAATLGDIATWKPVLNTSLVYEYSGPDSPAPDDVQSYRDWRRGLSEDPTRRES